MTQLRQIVSRGFISFFVALFSLTAAVPALALADSPTCTPPDTSSEPGVHVPVGSDASLYTYDCTSGLWVSAHFSYDPNTNTYTPLDPIVYTYDPVSGLYDYTIWVFSAPQNAYVQQTNTVTQPPAGATVIGGPAPVDPSPPSNSSDPGTQNISNTGDGSTNTITNNGTSGASQSINGTGANSTNGISGSAANNLTSNNTNGITLGNNLSGQANSGSVALLGNTVGGNATSGNATDTSTVVNMLQSAASALGSGNVVTFVQNINGDVNGDLLLDPATLGQVQPASAPSGNNTLTVNSQTNSGINNNINLGAQSGGVTVSQNTQTGNATSGAAEAIANVVNLIDSAVSAGKSFIGTININGNLNGDILIPPSFIDQLVATNVPTVTISTTGANSTNTVNNGTTGNNLNATNTNNMGITNNVNESSASGAVNSSGNTVTGNTSSGNAANSITAFNLTGSNVIGANDLLVFVNVLGSWVGMIVNAPPGATAAELCGGGCSVSNNPGSTTVNSNNTNNLGITNNINLAAQSGNVNAANNTKIGNLASGNADTAANLLNVENSTFSLANWFGILFINVFGTWHGSFGINTAAGNPLPGLGGTAPASGAPGAPIPALFFRFVPVGSGGSGGTVTPNHFNISQFPGSLSGTGGSGATNTTIATLASHTSPAAQVSQAVSQLPHSNFGRTTAIITTCCLLYIALDALYTRRHAHKAN